MLPLLPIAILWPLPPWDKGLEVELADVVPSGTFNDAADTILGDGSTPGVQFACRTSSAAKALCILPSPGHTKFSASCLYIKRMTPRHVMA